MDEPSLQGDGVLHLSAQGIFEVEGAGADGEVHACTEAERRVAQVTALRVLFINAAVEEDVCVGAFGEEETNLGGV